MTLGNDNGTDGQTDRRTDRQTDRVRRNMRPPPREEGRIIKVGVNLQFIIQKMLMQLRTPSFFSVAIKFVAAVWLNRMG